MTEHEKLVEQVARAISVSFTGEPYDLDLYRPEAIAALAAIHAALQEPSEGMLEAGHETLYEDAYDGTRDFAIHPTWQAMLDASPLKRVDG